METKRDLFGTLPEGPEIDVFTLSGPGGIEARVMTYGATLVSLKIPDRFGRLEDVILGFDNLEGYLGKNPYFGCTVGRYANRIGQGKFRLEGIEYTLARNDGANHLHGGLKGFDKKVWTPEPFVEAVAVGVKFTYLSEDGEEGYPGNLGCSVTYRLNAAGELRIAYEAVTDKATPVNLTNHAYWNLMGPGMNDILGHELELMADQYTPVDAALIPTGEKADVAGTPLDFTTPRSIGKRIASIEGGYDHNCVLRGGGESFVLAARVREPKSGRILEISTDQPGIQLYSGNFLDGTVRGKGGVFYFRHAGFCLETQHFPDSPNCPGFPSTILEPGETYRTATTHRFRKS